MVKTCSYCGHYEIDYDTEECECGGKLIIARVDSNNRSYSWDNVSYQDDFYYFGFNNIDNILEGKRARLKRRG